MRAVLLLLMLGCGSKTGLETGSRRDASVDAPPLGPCTHLEVVSGPELWWESDGEVAWSVPKLVGRNGGFDLLVRQSPLDHPHIHARRLELRERGVRLGMQQRVIPETHDVQQVAAAGDTMGVCSGADPGGPYRVLFRGYRDSFRERFASELPGSSSCQGLIATDRGWQLAYTTREMDSRGMLATFSVDGELLETEQPLLGSPDIEATIRVGRFEGGFAWLKRNRARNQYWLGMVRESTTVTEHEARNAALYLRAENWPLEDGTLALTYIDSPGETERGPRHLLVVDTDGNELFRRTSEVTSFGFVEPEMEETPNGLVWATPSVRDFDDVDIVVELYGAGAELVGEPVVFTERGGGHSTISTAFSSGFIAVAWDRRNADDTRDEVAGALLRCVR